MRAKFEVRHGLDYRPVVAQGPKAVVPFLPTAQRHLLHQYDGKERLDRAVTELSQALALAMPHEDTQRQPSPHVLRDQARTPATIHRPRAALRPRRVRLAHDRHQATDGALRPRNGDDPVSVLVADVYVSASMTPARCEARSAARRLGSGALPSR